MCKSVILTMGIVTRSVLICLVAIAVPVMRDTFNMEVLVKVYNNVFDLMS